MQGKEKAILEEIEDAGQNIMYTIIILTKIIIYSKSSNLAYCRNALIWYVSLYYYYSFTKAPNHES